MGGVRSGFSLDHGRDTKQQGDHHHHGSQQPGRCLCRSIDDNSIHQDWSVKPDRAFAIVGSSTNQTSIRWCSIWVGKPPFLAFKGHTHISTVLVACFTLIVLYTTCIFAGLPNHLTDCCPTLPTEYWLRPQHPFIRNQNHACSSTCHCPRPEISGDFGKRMGSKSLELMVVEANQPGLGYF